MKCARCKKEFQTNHPRRLYCSKKCKIAAGNARAASKEPINAPILRHKQPTFASAEVIDLGKAEEMVQKVQIPQKPKKSKKPSYAEVLYWRIKRRRAEKKAGIAPQPSEKRTNPRKDKFFSDVHPQQFALSRIFLPRLHTWFLLVGLMYAGIMEMVHRNQDFILDWLNATPLPNIMDAMLNFQTWFQKYGVAFIMIMLFIVAILFLLYYLLWRLPFKNYSKRSEGAKTYEGRCYWRTNNSLYRLWDRWYRSPPRTSNVYFLHVGWWPPLNIFDPSRSCIRLETSPQEKCEMKGIYDIIVDEYPIRAKKNNDPKWFITLKDGYSSEVIPINYAIEVFEAHGKVLVDDTMNMSYGNPDVRVDIVRGGASLVRPEFKEAVRNARAKAKQKLADPAQPDN